MNGKLITAFILTLFLMACATPHKVAKQINNLEGDWILAIFRPEQKKTLSEVFGTHAVELQFNKATNGIAGTTGCNRFAGTYMADTVNLKFSQNRVLTKMGCGDYDEQIFLNALDQVNKFRIAEGQLELLQDSDIVMVFARKQHG
jgi:heat shock protein HslJ